MSKSKTIFDKKNILVVGGAGFVGSHLCEELLKSNKVICLDNFLTGDSDNIGHLLQHPDFCLINHNIIEPIDLERQPELKEFKMEFQGLQEVYFLASPASPRAYLKYPIETLLVNSVGLRNALEMAVRYKSQFFYASSAAVYGDTSSAALVGEDYVGRFDQLSERACYVEAKKFGEALVHNYRAVHNLDAKIARIFNCYGPRQKLDDGRMIPEMINSALANKEVIVYGDKNSYGSYFFISDLIKAITKIMESSEAGPINIASDWKNNFVDVAEKIIKLTGSKSKVKSKELEAGLAPQPIADITLAKEALGWFPIILLDEGLKKTIDYLSAQRGVREPGAR